MKLQSKRIILTGATGGIGSEIARQLAIHGARLGLVGRNEQKLQQLAKQLSDCEYHLITADINRASDRSRIVTTMQNVFRGHDVLINTAGVMDFSDFLLQQDSRIEQTFQTNVIAPILLCKQALPYMLSQHQGQIVNIGSIFGSIGFAWFTTYSSSKFALRGFSQALRRELADTGVKVSYIAPRAVRTRLNSPAVYAMAEAVKMNMDTAEVVAKQIIDAITGNKKEQYLGFPESLFVRINALFPGLVDRATKKQNEIAGKFATRN